MDKKSHSKPRKYWFGGKKTEGLDDAVRDALDKDRWEVGSEEDWDAYWFTGMPGPSVFQALTPEKTVNHIPGNNGLTVKSMLYDTLETARKRLVGHPNAARFDFYPRVYSMPSDYFALQDAAAEDPKKLWIQKPKGLSRGRGIQVLKDASLAPKSDDWMVQDYLHRPHLYDGHKYVLRCYVVVRSVDPLRVYWYTEGFAKLASEEYSTDPATLSNLFVHLTNPDVNEGNEEAPASVVFISFTKYRQWLRDQGHDDVKIFQDLEDLVVLTMMSARERMRQRILATGTDDSGCFELFGLDCMLDADLKPWILECNLSPSLDVCSAPEDGGIDEARIKRQVVLDMVSMMGANEDVPDWSKAPTYSEEICTQWDWEKDRLGGFRCVYPGPYPARYIDCFPVPRYSDKVLAEHVSGRPLSDIDLVPNQVEEFVVDGALSLYHLPTQQFFAPNPTAAWIWLQVAEGRQIEMIVQELANQTGAPQHHVERDVWDTLADWAQKGLVRLRSDKEAPSDEESVSPPVFEGRRTIRIGENTLTVRYAHKPVERMLEDVGGVAPSDDIGDRDYAILKGAQGYTIVQEARVVASDVRLSRVVPLLVSELLTIEAERDAARPLVVGGLISLQNKNVLVVSPDPLHIGNAVSALSQSEMVTLRAGAVRLGSTAGTVDPQPFPVWMSENRAESLAEGHGLRLSNSVHEMSVGQSCRLVDVDNTDPSPVIDRIILLVESEEGESEVAPMAAADALTEIWRVVNPETGKPSDVVTWIEGLPVIRVRFNGMDDLTDLLAKACDLA